MDIVVLDTNVVVAAGFNPQSHAARIVAAVRAGQLRMAWHTTTREEIAHILRASPGAAETRSPTYSSQRTRW